MRKILLTSAALIGLTCGGALAQTQAGTQAMPAPTPGVTAQTHHIVRGSAEFYLRTAEREIAANHVAAAHHALEMAETRLLNRDAAMQQPVQPAQDPAVQQVEAALKALSAHDRTGAKTAVEAALQQASAGQLASTATGSGNASTASAGTGSTGTSVGGSGMNATGTAPAAASSEGSDQSTIGHSFGGTDIGLPENGPTGGAR